MRTNFRRRVFGGMEPSILLKTRFGLSARTGRMGLKDILQRELHDSRIVHGLRQRAQARRGRRSRLAEGWGDKCSLRRVQIWVIGEIENFPAKLHLLVFSYL